MSFGFFEDFWTRKAARAWNVPEGTPPGDFLERVRPSVETLSDLFTTERPANGHFRDYMSEPRLLAAYGLFFFPQSFARAKFALRRLFGLYGRAPEASDAPLRVLDLGSGASPCGFAAAEATREIFPERRIALTALDRSRDALAAAREIASALPDERLSVETVPADLRRLVPAKLALPPQDLILLGWSLNEAVPAPEDAAPFLKSLAPLLAPTGALVVLEPALKLTAERLQRASDAFALAPGEPFFRLAPELGTHACPLLREGVFWNHEVRKWTPPETLEFLNRTLFREISALKFSWCALGKMPGKTFSAPEGAAEIVRLVSPVEATKTCLRFVGVNPRGEKLSVEIPVRGLSKSEIKKIAADNERGDVVKLAGTLRPLGGENLFRLEGRIERESAAGAQVIPARSDDI